MFNENELALASYLGSACFSLTIVLTHNQIRRFHPCSLQSRHSARLLEYTACQRHTATGTHRTALETPYSSVSHEKGGQNTIIVMCFWSLNAWISQRTLSSVPSLQSTSPSHIHSSSRHSWLFGQRRCVLHGGGSAQSSSSE